MSVIALLMLSSWSLGEGEERGNANSFSPNLHEDSTAEGGDSRNSVSAIKHLNISLMSSIKRV
jgi:hypothetical protein